MITLEKKNGFFGRTDLPKILSHLSVVDLVMASTCG